MSSNLKRGCSLIMTLLLLLSCGLVAYAEENENVSISNECVNLNQQQIDTIFANLKENIEEYYSGLYIFNNYRIKCEPVETDPNSVDVTLIADMTLIRNPEDAPNVQGMKKAINQITDPQEKEIAQAALADYLASVMPYYNLPIETGFEFRVEIPPVTYGTDTEIPALDIYTRVDAEEEPILTPVEDHQKYQDIYITEDGTSFIEKALTSENSVQAYSVSFSANSAISYAVDHAMDEPEFNSSMGQSDCANFVSKCLNAGGIPQDKDGLWYGSTQWGDLYSAGQNWYRTGYNNNGGVMPYMRDKFYFQITPSGQATLGSIVYFNRKSHVGIVTIIDGTTIKYTAHSSTKKTIHMTHIITQTM